MDYIKEWFLSLIERLPATINPITMQYFANDWHNMFIIHVSNLITVGYYCLSSHDSQCSKYSLDTSDRGMSHHFKGSGEVANSLTGTKKLVFDVSVHFQLELNAPGLLVYLKN